MRWPAMVGWVPSQNRNAPAFGQLGWALVFRAMQGLATSLKTSELGTSHAFSDQVAFEALVRMTEEELKH